MVSYWDDLIGSVLANDIRQTFKKNNQNTRYKFIDSELYFLDGWKSRKTYEEVFSHLSSATKSIKVFSPYVSNPLLSFLKNNTQKGVELTIITPENNNKSIFKSILSNEFLKGYFTLLFYKERMSHLKAILVDDTTLVIGSSNFDFVSYYFEQEVIMVTRNKQLVGDFIKKVAIPDIKNSYSPSKSEFRINVFTPIIYSVILTFSFILAYTTHAFQSILKSKKN